MTTYKSSPISALFAQPLPRKGVSAAAFDEEAHPRDAAGKFTDGGSGEIPVKPGTTPIPEGHIRLYHYTNAPAAVIAREGLKLDKAKGETYGEPNVVWASAQMPMSGRTFVEFSVPFGDPRWVIGDPMKIGNDSTYEGKYVAPDGTTYNQSPADMEAKGSNVAFAGDIKPEEFIGIHEPWMEHYHYIKDDPSMVKEVLDGVHDNLLDDPNYGQAIRQIYAEAGKKTITSSGEIAWWRTDRFRDQD